MSFMCVSDSRITEKSLGSTSKGPRVASIGTTDKMDVEQPVIDDTLVRRMVAPQFPQWADLPVRSAAVGGWDNKTFHLGEHMIVRLPSAADYSAQVEKEHRWLPKLAPLLPLPIPTPLAMGEPAGGYPWRWSIYRWIEGVTAAPERIADLSDLAASLAQFLIALQRIDPTDAYRRDRPEAATFGPRSNVHVCTLACSFTWARRTARAAWRTKFFGEGNFSRRMSVVRVTVLRLMS